MKPVISRTNPTTPTNSTQKVPLLGWLLILSSFINASFGVYFTVSGLRWQNLVYLGSVVITTGLLISMLVFLRRGNKSTAALLFLSELVMRGLVNALLLREHGFVMQLLVLVLSAVVALEWLPQRYLGRIMPVILLTSLLMLASDLVDIPWQVDSPFPASSRFGVISGSVVMFILFVVVNIQTYSIRFKLIFMLLGLSAISVIGVAVATNLAAQQTVLADARFSLSSSAEDLAASIDRFVAYNLQSIQSLALTPELSVYLDITPEQRKDSDLDTEISGLLYSYLLRDPIAINSYALLDRNGIDIADTDPSQVGINKSYRSYFIAPFTTGATFVSPIYSSQSIDDPSLQFSSPVRNVQNQIIGVLVVHYKPEVLQSFVFTFNGTGGEKSFGVLLDDHNIILGHGLESDLIGSPLSSLREKVIGHSDSGPQFQESSALDFNNLSTALAGGTGESFVETQLISKEPIKSVAAIATMKNQPWKVVFHQPDSAFQAPIRTQTNVVIVIAEIVAFLVVLAGALGARIFSIPVLALTQTAEELARGNLSAKAIVTSRDEIGQLASTFNQMSGQLLETLENLEKRVQERTLAIGTAAQIGREIATILESETLLKKVVVELQQSFGYDHIHIYLLDSLNNRLMLVGANGEAGEMLLRQRHFLPIGRGLVGRAALNAQTILSADTQRDPQWLPTPLLPDTASEIAVPILLGEQLLGVLDVHQSQPNALTPQDIGLLELIANQVAAALQNANQYRETQNKGLVQAQINRALERLRSTTSVDEAFQVAFEEISLLTGTSNISAHLRVSGEKPDAS